MTASDRKSFIEVILGGKYDEPTFNKATKEFCDGLAPLHNFLWDFYRKNNLIDL